MWGDIFMVLIAFFAGRLYEWGKTEDDECPRIILGYDCRGNLCDHRRSEVIKAKSTKGDNQWPRL